MKYLQLLPFPSCCGAYVIGYFGFATTNMNSMHTPALSDIEADLIDCERRIGKGMVMAMINDEQVPHVEHLLEKHGYSLVAKDCPGKMRAGMGMNGMIDNDNAELNHTNNLYVKTLTSTSTTKLGKLEFHPHGKDQGTGNSTSGAHTFKKVAAKVNNPSSPSAATSYRLRSICISPTSAWR